jgi:hypothetical protein
MSDFGCHADDYNVEGKAVGQLWGSFASCASISSALFEACCSAARGRLETGQQT